ncbi:MAG: CBS domain-containing protein [Gemmataceae bacterium]
MWHPPKRTLDLSAHDLMIRDVVTLPTELSLRAAAHQLVQADVSGAPVVDATGRCVGVLTNRDIVHALEMQPATAEPQAADVVAEWQVFDRADLPVDEVARYMSTDVIAAVPDTPVLELARLMAESHVHRVVILDDAGGVVGLVSATDILAALAHEAAVPEWD